MRVPVQGLILQYSPGAQLRIIPRIRVVNQSDYTYGINPDGERVRYYFF